MTLHAVSGDVLENAPLNSEAIAIWMYTGFNTRQEIWRRVFEEKGSRLSLAWPPALEGAEADIPPASPEYKPWTLNHETLWRIDGGNMGRVKYFYVFPNPKNISRLDSLESLNAQMRRCLTVLQEQGVRSISFILIPASTGEAGNGRSEDRQSA